MPSFFAWSYTGALSWTDLTYVFCAFDSGVQSSVTSVIADYDATSPVNTANWAIYAHFYSATDTPPITGTGYFVPPTNPDPLARGLEITPYGAGHWLAAGGSIDDPSPPHERVQVYVYPRLGGGGVYPKQFNLTLNGGWSGGLGSGYCAYGYQLKPAQRFVEVISAAAIAALIVAFPEFAVLGIVFEALIGVTWVPGNVCSGPAPELPIWTPDDWVLGTSVPSPSGFAKAMQAWQAMNWSLYCECAPATGGGPTPVSPPPVYILPDQPYIPVPPSPVVCDTADLCATLNSLSRLISSVSAQVAYLRQDVTLIQRQGVPFGYLVGTIHSALSGQGEFSVQGILGLAVEFLALPTAEYPPIAGDPQTFHQVGKISVGTVDGWLRSWQPTHSPYMLLDLSGAITKVGYIFPSGIVATIRELIREP